jgi:hypothetical protein
MKPLSLFRRARTPCHRPRAPLTLEPLEDKTVPAKSVVNSLQDLGGPEPQAVAGGPDLRRRRGS